MVPVRVSHPLAGQSRAVRSLRGSLVRCLNCRWLPRVVPRYQPSSRSTRNTKCFFQEDLLNSKEATPFPLTTEAQPFCSSGVSLSQIPLQGEAESQGHTSQHDRKTLSPQLSPRGRREREKTTQQRILALQRLRPLHDRRHPVNTPDRVAFSNLFGKRLRETHNPARASIPEGF